MAKLKPSPNLSLSFDFQGRPLLFPDTYPYQEAVQIAEPHRVLLSFFEGTGTPERIAVDRYLRSMRLSSSSTNRKTVAAVVAKLADAGILVDAEDPISLYDSQMAEAYHQHRPVPARLARWIIRQGRIRPTTAVLDLACGTGALTNQLARVSRRVRGMDVSRSFLRIAEREARANHLRVDYVNESVNRLAFHPGRYSVVTICQAFHWLDPLMAARGIQAVLVPEGRLFLADLELEVGKTHPLEEMFRPPRGARFGQRSDYYGKLFDVAAQGAPGGLRIRKVLRFQQRQPMDAGYLKGFLSPLHLKEAKISGWRDPERFWQRLEPKLRSMRRSDLMGTFHWSVVMMSRSP